MKHAFVKTITVLLVSAMVFCSFAAFMSSAEIAADARSVILIEAFTGKVLYEDNADEMLPPASVTKVMTMLLVMEAIDEGVISLSDTVTVSDVAASMGGSQIYLEVGEQMSVEDLLKSVVVASANDAACALAEFVAGSEEEFVSRMNVRAKELGMNNTNFENTNGLDDTTDSHLISARDIAIMSAELITKHPKILEYSTIWQDTVRDGQFTLSNTNRLIRFYNGANGLKTGSTSKAKFCISASAKRDGMQLIAVVMGSSTRDNRNATAKALLDYGFANYSYAHYDSVNDIPIKISKGVKSGLKAGYEPFDAVVKKGSADKITVDLLLPDSVTAPIRSGDTIGKVIFSLNGETIGEENIVSLEDIAEMTIGEMFLRLLRKFVMI